MGPTAVGKTELAMRVADTLADEGIGVDLISVDAVQVYRGLNIGSAKPDADTLKRYPHALIDIRSPLETYDAWQFCRDALACMEQSRRQQRIPVLVGGSMFYFAALLHGLDQLPGADPKFRPTAWVGRHCINAYRNWIRWQQRTSVLTIANASPEHWRLPPGTTHNATAQLCEPIHVKRPHLCALAVGSR
jgi:tRNA A37 N6-isopentenylltransferase MiaA